MRLTFSGVRICQKHFRPHVLTTFILIFFIASAFTDIKAADVNPSPKVLSQGLTTPAVWHTGHHARTTSSWQPTPTPSTVPTPTPSAAPIPAIPIAPALINSSATSPSGQAMPGGDLPGWHQILAEDFNSNVGIGNFPGGIYASQLTVYPDGAKDTAAMQQGAPSRYYPSKVASVSNGLLNLYLHTENGTPMAATILPTIPGNHLYGKYTIRFRSDALPGYKVAWMLWPDSGYWPHDGEIDFPESALDSTIGGFVHHLDATWGGDQDAYTSTATYTSWHTASIEWTSNKVNFLLDDQPIGTSTTRIPNTPMHWVIQTESCLPTCPAATTAGNLQIDWMAAYAPM